jgi:hypothetical protein
MLRQRIGVALPFTAFEVALMGRYPHLRNRAETAEDHVVTPEALARTEMLPHEMLSHLVRLAAGPDHRLLLPSADLSRAALLILADLLARTLAAPAEVPIGLITAFAGGPCFLALILRTRHLMRTCGRRQLLEAAWKN